MTKIEGIEPVAVAEELRPDGVYFLKGYGGLKDEDVPCLLYPTCPADQLRAAQVKVLRDAIDVVEKYEVSVGNSRAGELAAKWTMDNLREVRDELRRMADELEKQT